jgi:hypothetical protein
MEMWNEEWELAAVNKQPFTIMYGRDEDIEQLLARETLADGATTAS